MMASFEAADLEPNHRESLGYTLAKLFSCSDDRGDSAAGAGVKAVSLRKAKTDADGKNETQTREQRIAALKSILTSLTPPTSVGLSTSLSSSSSMSLTTTASCCSIFTLLHQRLWRRCFCSGCTAVPGWRLCSFGSAVSPTPWRAMRASVGRFCGVAGPVYC